MKKIIFSALLFLLMIFAVQAISLVGLLVLKKKNAVANPIHANQLTARQIETLTELINGQKKYIAHDPVLGWSIKVNGTSETYQANAQGIRADREYDPTSSGPLTRILTFGDSFVHCDEVKNNETWQHYLQQRNNNLEVINFGTPGYGTDQAYLRYIAQGKKFETDIVIIGFMSENPRRNVNIFRPFYVPNSEIPLAKPRFDLVDGKLQLLENPMPSLDDYQELLDNPPEVLDRLRKYDKYHRFGAKKSWKDRLLIFHLFDDLKAAYAPPPEKMIKDGSYNPNTDYYQVTTAVLKKFYDEVKTSGATPLVVVLPNKADLMRWKLYKNKVHASFLEFMDQHDMQYLDMTEEFYNDKEVTYINLLFMPGGHYSPLANQFAAKYIHTYLSANQLITPDQ